MTVGRPTLFYFLTQKFWWWTWGPAIKRMFQLLIYYSEQLNTHTHTHTHREIIYFSSDVHYHCNQNRQSIGVSSNRMHTTAALLQIHTQINCFLTPCFCTLTMGKNKFQSLGSGEGNSIWCRLITITETAPVKQMQPHMREGKEKKKKKTFRGSDIWEQFKVSKLSISTSHFKVCKNTFHLYQHTGCISSAFLWFYIFFADWDTWILGLNGSL